MYAQNTVAPSGCRHSPVLQHQPLRDSQRLHNTQHSTAQHSTAQHSTAPTALPEHAQTPHTTPGPGCYGRGSCADKAMRHSGRSHTSCKGLLPFSFAHAPCPLKS
eukprot:3455065-Rhodomonas_salina.2